MHDFRLPNFRKNFCYERIQSNLLDLKWFLGVFRSISQTFSMKNYSKLLFRSWMHYFRVPNFRKKFYHERIHDNLLDPKQCLGLFLSILQNFATKNHAKLVFRDWKHSFEVMNFRQKFSHEHLKSNLLDPKRCLGVFRSISQRFIMNNHGKLVFRGWMHYFGLPNFRKNFATNASNLTC